MTEVSFEHRRQVMVNAATDPEFRDLLLRDPRRALRSVMGRAVDADRVTVLEEQPSAWAFVMPATLPGPVLPQPFNDRTFFENKVFNLLHAKPDLAVMLRRDTQQFLKHHLGVDLGTNRVDVLWEKENEVILVLAHSVFDSELNDEMLELVSAGGQQGSNV